jgi:intron-binding protein aquarius
MFDELESFRAFEIMRTGPDRVDYLLTKEAKIIAMTCTHAALKRHDVCELSMGWKRILTQRQRCYINDEPWVFGAH